MMFKRLASGLVTALAAFTILAAATHVSAAVRPNPPTRICIDQTCLPEDPEHSGEGIKWHPGHYVFIGGNKHTPEIITRNLKLFDQIGNEPNLKGVQLYMWWGDLEGPNKGDYSPGYALIDTYLKKLKSLKYPKQLMIVILERAFVYGAPADKATMAKFYPMYLLSSEYNSGYAAAPAGTQWSGGLTFVARLWEAPVMDRLVALSKALGSRYDKDPNVEMLSLAETTLNPPVSGFSQAAYGVQLQRWYAATKQAWPHTQLRLYANYFGSDTDMTNLISKTTAAAGVAVGGPDPELPLPTITRSIQANRIFRAGSGGGNDLRGQIPWVGEQQEFGLTGRFVQTPNQIFDYQYGTMRASYMIWLMNTYAGGDPQKWATGILPYIRSVGGKIHAECPESYQNRCEPK